jgi:Family of unknown function (DUF6011)
MRLIHHNPPRAGDTFYVYVTEMVGTVHLEWSIDGEPIQKDKFPEDKYGLSQLHIAEKLIDPRFVGKELQIIGTDSAGADQIKRRILGKDDPIIDEAPICKPDTLTPEKFPVIRDVMNHTDKVRFRSSNGSKVTLRHIGTKRHPGPIHVEVGGTSRGTIGTDGSFDELADEALNDLITDVLREFNRNPSEALERYGRETGVCGVCDRTLTNPESIARGIGPVCARKVLIETLTGDVA